MQGQPGACHTGEQPVVRWWCLVVDESLYTVEDVPLVESVGVDGVGGDADGGVQQAGPAVAEGRVGELFELPVVGEAAGEGEFGVALPAWVAEYVAGELLGAG